jgi:PAS domain-containing protein
VIRAFGAHCRLQTSAETSNGEQDILFCLHFDADARSHGKARFNRLAEGRVAASAVLELSMPEMTNKSKEQKIAEAEVESFRKDLGPFVVAAETTRMAMVFADAKEPAHPIIFANDAFLSLTGYDRDEVLGHSFNFLMARGADPKALAQVEAAFEGQH